MSFEEEFVYYSTFLSIEAKLVLFFNVNSLSEYTDTEKMAGSLEKIVWREQESNLPPLSLDPANPKTTTTALIARWTYRELGRLSKMKPI